MGVFKDYKVCFPDRNIYISEDHNWAFAAWEIYKWKGNIKPNATLVHVDHHLDDVWDGIETDGLFEMETGKDVFKVTDDLKIDNFIWAGFATDSVEKIIYVTSKEDSSQSHDPFDFTEWEFNSTELENMHKLLENKKYTGIRLEEIDDLVVRVNNNELSSLIEGKSLILDLDLDYFNKSVFMKADLMDDAKIRSDLIALRDLCNWDLITVALSSLFCGGDDDCWHIYQIFLDVFELNLKNADIW